MKISPADKELIQSIKTRDDLTQDLLKQIMRYYPDEGVFRWRKTFGIRAQAGSVIGYTDDRDSYAKVAINGIEFGLQRLVFLYMEGYIPTVIDHINRIKSDNRWCNLRSVTPQENSENKEGVHMIDIDGEVKCLSYHCRKYKIDKREVYALVSNYGATFEEAVNFILGK